jgi:hypothetical protein
MSVRADTMTGTLSERTVTPSPTEAESRTIKYQPFRHVTLARKLTAWKSHATQNHSMSGEDSTPVGNPARRADEPSSEEGTRSGGDGGTQESPVGDFVLQDERADSSGNPPPPYKPEQGKQTKPPVTKQQLREIARIAGTVVAQTMQKSMVDVIVEAVLEDITASLQASIAVVVSEIMAGTMADAMAEQMVGLLEPRPLEPRNPDREKRARKKKEKSRTHKNFKDSMINVNPEFFNILQDMVRDGRHSECSGTEGTGPSSDRPVVTGNPIVPE